MRLIRKIVSLNLKNYIMLSMIIFNSQIRSQIDYAFPLTLSPCQKIAASLQTLQTRALRCINYFPLKISIKQIHSFFRTELVKYSAASTARKFAKSRQHQTQLQSDYNLFVKGSFPGTKYKLKTIFETNRLLKPLIFILSLYFPYIFPFTKQSCMSWF